MGKFYKLTQDSAYWINWYDLHQVDKLNIDIVKRAPSHRCHKMTQENFYAIILCGFLAKTSAKKKLILLYMTANHIIRLNLGGTGKTKWKISSRKIPTEPEGHESLRKMIDGNRRVIFHQIKKILDSTTMMCQPSFK